MMKRRVMRRLQSALATLLSLAGLAVASIPALAQEPAQDAAWLLAVESGDLDWEREGGPTCQDTVYSRTIEATARDTLYHMPVECPDLQTLAPGDSGRVGTYIVRYDGRRTLRLQFRAEVSGALFSGEHPLELTITDNRGNTYPTDGNLRNAPSPGPGSPLIFTVNYSWDRTAGNAYQGQQGKIFLTLLARGTGRPGGGDDGGGGGGDGPGDTPPVQPPTTETETPTPVTSGRVVVRVLGDVWGDGDLIPLPGASVSLGAFEAETDGSGQAVFEGLPFGHYTAMATAANPVSGTSPLTGTGSAAISAEEPEGFITIVLAWPPVPRTPPGEPGEPAGSLTVRVLDASPRNAGEPKPIAGAVVQVADRAGYTNARGELRFENLPLATYTAFAEAADPARPDGPRRSGTAVATLTPEQPDQTVTIELSWPDRSEADRTPGAIAGRICAPREGGARIWATNEAGETVATVVAATGRLGVWLDYSLRDLTPGVWTLTLQNPGDREVSQRVVVLPGQVTAAPDFTLACTGEGPTAPPGLGYYAVGCVLLLSGWQLRRMARKLQG